MYLYITTENGIVNQLISLQEKRELLQKAVMALLIKENKMFRVIKNRPTGITGHNITSIDLSQYLDIITKEVERQTELKENP